MERNEKIEALLARWYAGETTDAEEASLRKRFENDGQPHQGLNPAEDDRDIDALLFAGFRALADERMPAAPAPRSNRRPMLRIVWRAVAVAAVVAIGTILGLQLRTPYCYIDGVAVYDKETALAATDCLNSLSALKLPDRMLDQLLENLTNTEIK